MDKGKFVCTLIAILLAYVHYCQEAAATAVSATPCGNGGAGCTDAHSVCDNNVQMCKCSDGYKEDSKDESTCVIIPAAAAAVSATSCGSGGAGCTDAHSVCDNDAQTPMCKCSDGYKEDSNGGSTCVINAAAATAVSATPCGNDGAGCTDAHSVCDNAQIPMCTCSDGYKEDSKDQSTCVIIPAVLDTACPNGDGECTAASSVCDGADTSPKCKCSDGFRQDTQDHTKCKKELGQACSEGECLTNAQCDTTCKCSDEHIEKDGLCVVPSSAIKAGCSEIVMMMWVLCVVSFKLF